MFKNLRAEGYKSPVLPAESVKNKIFEYIKKDHSKLKIDEYNLVSLSFDYIRQEWNTFFMCNEKAITRTGCHFSIRVSNELQPPIRYSGGK